MGLGVLCFTIGGPESVKPLIELYKKEIENAEPVGDFVNDNIMVTTQLLCLEDGQRARDLGANIGMGYHRSLLLRYLDTFPRPAGIPEWPELLPDPTPAEIDEAITAGDTPYGTPDEVERRDPQVRRRGCRPGRVRAAVVDDGSRPRDRDDRDVRQARAAARSTRTRCTARPVSARPPPAADPARPLAGAADRRRPAGSPRSCARPRPRRR